MCESNFCVCRLTSRVSCLLISSRVFSAAVSIWEGRENVFLKFLLSHLLILLRSLSWLKKSTPGSGIRWGLYLDAECLYSYSGVLTQQQPHSGYFGSPQRWNWFKKIFQHLLLRQKKKPLSHSRFCPLWLFNLQINVWTLADLFPISWRKCLLTCLLWWLPGFGHWKSMAIAWNAQRHYKFSRLRQIDCFCCVRSLFHLSQSTITSWFKQLHDLRDQNDFPHKVDKQGWK